MLAKRHIGPCKMQSAKCKGTITREIGFLGKPSLFTELFTICVLNFSIEGFEYIDMFVWNYPRKDVNIGNQGEILWRKRSGF
jgi:hypothetical protein